MLLPGVCPGGVVVPSPQGSLGKAGAESSAWLLPLLASLSFLSETQLGVMSCDTFASERYLCQRRVLVGTGQTRWEEGLRLPWSVEDSAFLLFAENPSPLHMASVAYAPYTHSLALCVHSQD